MTGDNKNFILAIVLSMAIIAGWQYFYVNPMMKEKEKQTTTEITTGGGTTTTTPDTTTPVVNLTRAEAIALTPRVKIDTPALEGSINLKGASIDDIRLKNYRETVDPASPIITFLSPKGAPDALFAEHGLSAAEGSGIKVPGPDSMWVAPANAVLTATTPLTLTFDNGAGLLFSRIISVDDKYMFTVKQEVKNTTAAPVALTPYALVQRQGLPKTQGIWVLYEGPHGILGGQEQRQDYATVTKSQGPISLPSTGGWLGFTDKYWAVSVIPDQKSELTGEFVHQKKADVDVFQSSYIAKAPLQIPAGGQASYESHVFAGAKIAGMVEDYKAALGIDKFDLLIDWGWFWYFTKPLYYLIDWLYGIIGNFGLAILAITVLVKLAFFPLQNKSYASMSKMKKLQPKIEEMRKLHADDKMRQQQELIALYKTEKVSPLAGCVPVLLQIPVFFSLYKVIYTTIELRHAPFFGWIHDLSAGDPTSIFNLFGLIPFTPPSFLMLGVWPLVMGVTMWMQMRLNPTPPDPVQAAMFNWMPVMFTFMMASFPAGLVIYWAWNNLLGILQQSYIMKKNGVEVDFFGNIANSLPFLKKKKAAI